jgi:hypothetical protein
MKGLVRCNGGMIPARKFEILGDKLVPVAL